MIAKNKLWALPSSENVSALQSQYEHFYIDNDHCLIISPETPQGAIEITDELQKLLTLSDWQWLYDESEKIRQYEVAKHTAELEQLAREFSEKFLAELKKIKEGETNGQDNTDHGTASPE